MKKKILFVNDEMCMGGVARILNTLLKNIDRDKYEVDLLVLHKTGELLKEVPSDINIIYGTKFFNTVDVPLKQSTLTNIFSKLRLLFYMKSGLVNNKIKKERKKILHKHYDIEFSAKEGFCTIFVSNGDSDIKLNWVQVDYQVNNYSKNHMPLIKKALNNIDMNIACSNKVCKAYSEIFSVSNIMVIHNLMNEEYIYQMSLKDINFKTFEDKINLICVARFHYQKGLDILIKAYSKVSDYYHLVIIGDGELKDEIYKLAKDLNVFDKISWLGLKDNPYPYIRKSDLFIMTSRYEGFPTITIESLISSTPVLALKVAGINEQITKEEYGFVIENDLDCLVNKLLELRNSKELLLEYKNKLSAYHYNNEAIMQAYYRLFGGQDEI